MNIREKLFANTKTAILALYTLNLLIMGVHVLFFTAFTLTPCRWGGQTVDEWINMADQKLYVGKNEGKNRLVM